MFRADVVVAEPARLIQRQLQHLLGSWGERDFLVRRPLTAADRALDLGAHALGTDVEGFQDLAGDTLALADDPEQDVLRPNRAVVQPLGFLLGEDDHSAGTLRESFKHLAADLLPARLRATSSGDPAAFYFYGPNHPAVPLPEGPHRSATSGPGRA